MATQGFDLRFFDVPRLSVIPSSSILSSLGLGIHQKGSESLEIKKKPFFDFSLPNLCWSNRSGSPFGSTVRLLNLHHQKRLVGVFVVAAMEVCHLVHTVIRGWSVRCWQQVLAAGGRMDLAGSMDGCSSWKECFTKGRCRVCWQESCKKDNQDHFCIF